MSLLIKYIRQQKVRMKKSIFRTSLRSSGDFFEKRYVAKLEAPMMSTKLVEYVWKGMVWCAGLASEGGTAI